MYPIVLLHNKNVIVSVNNNSVNKYSVNKYSVNNNSVHYYFHKIKNLSTINKYKYIYYIIVYYIIY